MLYKPKNMYPRLGSDQPIIYLDDNTVDFTFSIEGNEKIETVNCLGNTQNQLSLPNQQGWSSADSFYNVNENGALSFYVTAIPLYNQEVYDIMGTADIECTNDNGALVLSQSIYALDNYGSGGPLWYSFNTGRISGKFCTISLDGRLNASYYVSLDSQSYWISKIFSNINKDDVKWAPSAKVYLNTSSQLYGEGKILFANLLNTEVLQSGAIDNLTISKQDLVLGKTICEVSLDAQMVITSLTQNSSIVIKETAPDYFKSKHICSIDQIQTADSQNIVLKCKTIVSTADNPSLDKETTSIVVHKLLQINLHLTLDSADSSLYRVTQWEIPSEGLRLSFLVDQQNFFSTSSSTSWKGIETTDFTVGLSVVGSSPGSFLGEQSFGIYPNNTKYFTYTIEKDTLSQLSGDFSYKLLVNDKIYSDKVNTIISANKPILDISYSTNSILKNNFIGNFTPSTAGETVVNYQWKLYRGTYNEDIDQVTGQLIYQTDRIYSQDFQFEYDNLIPGDCVVEAIVEDNYGQTWSKREQFNVNYEENELYLNLQNELDKENTGVKLNWDKLQPNVVSVYTCGNILDDYSYQEFNKYSINDNSNLVPTEESGYFALKINNLQFNLNKIKYIECLGEFKPRYSKSTARQLTYNFLNTNLQLNVKSDWSRKRLNSSYLQLTIRYYVDLQYDGETIPEFSLEDKVVFSGSHANLPSSLFESSYIMSKITNQLTISAFQIDLDKKSLRLFINDKTIEIENININNFKNLELNNCTQLDYLIASKESKFMFGDSFSCPSKNELGDWNSGNYDCLLTFLNEDNYLGYRDPDIATNFTGYNMKRYNPLNQKVLNMGQYYFTSENTEEERRFIDYSLPHNEEVEYLIYPLGNETIKDSEGNQKAQEIFFSPIYSDTIKGDWDKWCLFTTRGPAPKNLDGTADNGYNENVLLVDKVFFFEMNVETGNMSNNTDFSVVKNFTSYPHIQRSPSNYWSGQLKGLLGRLAIDDCTFKQTPDMLQELKELTQNTSRKFLKDRDGNFWEVELSSAITIDNNDKLDVQLKTKSFNWVEVGDASDIALVSVGPSKEDWLLTELGHEKIDISKYIWDDDAIWDDNDFWTENE